MRLLKIVFVFVYKKDSHGDVTESTNRVMSYTPTMWPFGLLHFSETIYFYLFF